MKLILSIILTLGVLANLAQSNELVSPEQQKFIERYKKQSPIKPEDALINSDKEPELNEGFTNLYNGKDLSGWRLLGGKCEFFADGEAIRGVCVKGEPTTFLTTEKEDYKDFIFTIEMKWLVNGNSGVMFRSNIFNSKKGPDLKGPQVEMEGFTTTDRNWSGGIYGQNSGGWKYPMWLRVHEDVRNAMKKNEFNRLTIQVKDNVVKTWVNGLPATHYVITEERYASGPFGLQIHQGHQGTILFKNIKVKEL